MQLQFMDGRLVRIAALALEEKLIEAYEQQGMTRSDAQGLVEAILMEIR